MQQDGNRIEGAGESVRERVFGAGISDARWTGATRIALWFCALCAIAMAALSVADPTGIPSWARWSVGAVLGGCAAFWVWASFAIREPSENR
jgi:amino acid transporter